MGKQELMAKYEEAKFAHYLSVGYVEHYAKVAAKLDVNAQEYMYKQMCMDQDEGYALMFLRIYIEAINQ